jgi:hypothetical protein
VNYFSYFSEIEDTFIRRRGKHLMLSPMDWALIEGWKERGLPLHVVVRAIEHAFDSYDAKKQKRTVKTLLYCQEEVEAQYAEWLQSRVGSHDEPADSEPASDSTSPFPRAAVVAHLGRSLETLGALGEERRQTNDDELSEALARAITLLSEIKSDYESAAHPDTRRLEDSLTGIERLLDEAILRSASASELESIDAEVDLQVKPYKRHMDKAAFEQTRDNLRRKHLRDHFGVPRLSLFFL